MQVDLSECVRRIFAELDIDDLVAALNAPAEPAVELTGRPVSPRPAEVPARG